MCAIQLAGYVVIYISAYNGDLTAEFYIQNVARIRTFVFISLKSCSQVKIKVKKRNVFIFYLFMPTLTLHKLP